MLQMFEDWSRGTISCAEGEEGRLRGIIAYSKEVAAGELAPHSHQNFYECIRGKPLVGLLFPTMGWG